MIHVRSLPAAMAERLKDLDPVAGRPPASAAARSDLHDRILATDRTVDADRIGVTAARPRPAASGRRRLLPVVVGVAVFGVVIGVSAVVAVANRPHGSPAAGAAGPPPVGFGLLPASRQLTTRLVLDRTRVPAGLAITGALIVTNHGGTAVNLTHRCPPQYVVALTVGSRRPADVAFTAECGREAFIMNPGQNRLPVKVNTTYRTCSAVRYRSTPPCLKPMGMPALPPGRYNAVLVGDGTLRLPAPQPVSVVLEAAQTPPTPSTSATPCVGTVVVTVGDGPPTPLSYQQPLSLTVRVGEVITVTGSSGCAGPATGDRQTDGVLASDSTRRRYTALRPGTTRLTITRPTCSPAAPNCQGGLSRDGVVDVTVIAP